MGKVCKRFCCFFNNKNNDLTGLQEEREKTSSLFWVYLNWPGTGQGKNSGAFLPHWVETHNVGNAFFLPCPTFIVKYAKYIVDHIGEIIKDFFGDLMEALKGFFSKINR